ncbi:MAG: hypothetical protein R2817_05670 [Flavobacteriales bacterium]
MRSNKVSRNLITDKDVQVIEVEGRSLIKIHVPRADRRERPVYIGLDPYKGTYRRNHEGDFLCNREEVTRMFADQRAMRNRRTAGSLKVMAWVTWIRPR